MPRSRPVAPWSGELSLDETVERLRQNHRVRAIGYLGSTATDQWTDASDFDLCVVLSDYPLGCGVEATIVDGRIADIVIIDADRAAAWANASDAEAVADHEWPFVHWISRVRAVFDPERLAAEARDGAGRLVDMDVVTDPEAQRTTRSFVTHDLRVNTALLGRVDDPVLRVAFAMRQLHTFVSAVQAWFTARGVRHEGWKRDVAYIERVDPAFFAVIETWLAAGDPAIRHALYREAVDIALSPIGGPLPPGTLLQRADQEWEGLGTGRG
jgi:predicted nucleotidyltransferase